jgi:cell shape-determining protein MreC
MKDSLRNRRKSALTNAERQARWREKHGVKRLRERIAELENENAKLKKELGRPRETSPALHNDGVASPRVKVAPDHLL